MLNQKMVSQILRVIEKMDDLKTYNQWHDEWSEKTGWIIMDPDGLRYQQYIGEPIDPDVDLITYIKFINLMCMSTITSRKDK